MGGSQYPVFSLQARRRSPGRLAAFFRSKVCLLQHLTAPAVGELADAAEVRDFRKGEFVCRAGEPARAVWFVLDGRICVNRCGWGGQRRAIEIMVKGDAFGMPALVFRTCPSEIQALEDSRLARIPLPAVLRVLDRSPRFALDVLRVIGQRMQFMESMLLLSQEPADRRIAAALWYLRHKFGNSIPLTRSEIGEMAGTAPETAMRVLKTFAERGIVHRRTGRIVIADPEALRAEWGVSEPDREAEAGPNASPPSR